MFQLIQIMGRIWLNSKLPPNSHYCLNSILCKICILFDSINNILFHDLLFEKFAFCSIDDSINNILFHDLLFKKFTEALIDLFEKKMRLNNVLNFIFSCFLTSAIKHRSLLLSKIPTRTGGTV